MNNKAKDLNPYKNKSLNLYAIEWICHLSYSQRLSKLDLKPPKVRRDLKILKYVLKSIYNFGDVPLEWKNKFAMKDSRNGIMPQPIHTRVRLRDKNFYLFYLFV